MNEVISKLADAGCDIDKGLETCYDEEELYLSSLRQFAEDDTPQKMERAYRSNNIDKCRMYACSFSRVLYNLGMREMYYLNDSIFASAENGGKELGRLVRLLVAKKNKMNEIIYSA